MIPQVVTVGPLVLADPDGVSLTQTPGAAGDLLINGAFATAGVATLDTARRVIITSAGDDSNKTFTVYGTNHTGNPIQETVVGGNVAAVSTLQDFLTVTRIAVSAATAGAVTAGTSGVASSPWKSVDIHFGPVNLSFGVIVSGVVNWSVEYCYENFNSNQSALGSQPLGNYPVAPNVYQHPTLNSLTIKADGTLNDPIFGWRLTLNSQTNPGYATATMIQAGIQNAPWS